MPSAVSSPGAPHKVHATPSQTKFKTVLGFGALFKDSDPSAVSQRRQPSTVTRPRHIPRGSLDTGARSYKQRRRHRAERSVTDGSFFERDAVDISLERSDLPNPESITYPENMRALDTNYLGPTARRIPVRVETEGGPWSVSVAETPYDSRSYSLYIKTPTHNLTLTRTLNEIIELHYKLREAHPNAKVPELPVDAAMVASPPPKRKSAFLNTLSRLASPAGNKSMRQSHRAFSNISASTSLASPSHEEQDPFTASSTNISTNGTTPAPSISSPTSSQLPNNNSTMTALAAYLTTVANGSSLNSTRVWKRFVRVRRDDLESVRAERAIKRVRSDLAAHLSPKTRQTGSTGMTGVSSPADASEVESVSDSLRADEVEEPLEKEPSLRKEESIKEEKEEDAEQHRESVDAPATITNGSVEEDRPESPHSVKALPNGEASTGSSVAPIDIPAAPRPAEEEDINGPRTPVATDLPGPGPRIPRSHSADADRARRTSRAYSTPDGASASSAAGETGDDESSVSTTAGRRGGRKKRARDADGVKDSAGARKKSQRKAVIDDFEMLRVLGKGCAGKVLLVRHKASTDLYALKAITKRHVLAHQELQHTLTEQAVLKRMAAESKDPFVVKLWWSFHDKENLFLVMDFHPGGDLATQLARWGRLGRDRARFYAAEIVEGVEGLHAAGVIYRDLKPENILIGADGHIVLTDFGLSKEFPRRAPNGGAGTGGTQPGTPTRGDFSLSMPSTPQPVTPHWMKGEGAELAWPGPPVGQMDMTTTFCGTAEYLAPEVIQGLPYSYEVDWWSFGTMLYEMLTGITPFWANNHSDMYVRVLQDELQFPEDRAIDQDTKSLIRGLLQRNPALRMCEPRIKRHPYFSMIDWSHVYYKRYIPPYIPPIDPSNASDTQNFDDTFLDMDPVIDDGVDNDQTDTDMERDQTDTDRTDGEESNTTPSQSRSSSVHPIEDDSVDVFDGYSFKGRYSVIIDEEDVEEDEEEEEEEVEDSTGVLEEATTTTTSEQPAPAAVNGVAEGAEEAIEPKTPEARRTPLPPVESEPETTLKEVSEAGELAEQQPEDRVQELLADQESSVAQAAPEAVTTAPSTEHHLPVTKETKEGKEKKATFAPKPVNIRPGATARSGRGRREKSGIPALDRYLSDTIDEEGITEREDDDDDDWDIIDRVDGEDRNGARGTSLFARGVVDKYRLAVFRKTSTPTHRPSPHSVSSASKVSDADGSEAADSPSPSEKRRRGRNPGLTFRKHPRQFLRAKSPPSVRSNTSSATARSANNSNSATLSASSTVSSAGMLTPSLSIGSTLPPSLKSKESALSMGANSHSSDQSGNGDAVESSVGPDTVRGIAVPAEETDKQKPKKLKKYKEGAEKVLSLFQSPKAQS